MKLSVASRPIPGTIADYSQLLEGGDVVWLDSVMGRAGLGERSLLALRFREVLRVEGGQCRFEAPDGVVFECAADADFFDRADANLRAWAAAGGTEAPGQVGYLSYEFASIADPGIPARPSVDGLPDAWCAHVEAALVEDRRGLRVVVVDVCAASAAANAESLEREIRATGAICPAPEPLERVSVSDGDLHRANVSNILDAITAGRVFQGCYTFAIPFRRPESLAAHYVALRSLSPGDFAAYLKVGDVELASSSPERFLSIRDGEVVARPMKGTRARVRGRELFDADALRADEKDRAENVMIVDLLRNDLGRACVPGTVAVTSLFEVEVYETVLQMTSTVRGRLAPQQGPWSVVRAAFPPGSMTGAPKVEACRMLQELEAGPRGLYAGSLMWLGYDGRAELSVVIRSFQAVGDEISWSVGGGIVADSEPQSEWEEALLKASPAFALSAPALEGQPD